MSINQEQVYQVWMLLVGNRKGNVAIIIAFKSGLTVQSATKLLTTKTLVADRLGDVYKVVIGTEYELLYQILREKNVYHLDPYSKLPRFSSSI